MSDPVTGYLGQCFSKCVPRNPRDVRVSERRNCVMAGRLLLAVLNLCVRIKIRVATFDTNHSVADSTACRQSLLQSRNVLILQSSHSAQLAIDRGDVSGETVRLSIGLRLAVDFVLIMYIKDNKIAAFSQVDIISEGSSPTYTNLEKTHRKRHSLRPTERFWVFGIRKRYGSHYTTTFSDVTT